MHEKTTSNRRRLLLWVVLLALPLFVAAALHWTATGRNEHEALSTVLESLLKTYGIQSAPLWIWSAAAAVLEASDKSLLGGLAGANALLLLCAVLVLSSHSPSAVNGWLAYLLGSPLAIGIGSIAGHRLRKANNAA